MVTGTFTSRAQVDRAVEALLDGHFNPEDIRIVLVTRDGEREVPLVIRTGMTRFAAIGAMAGAIAGAIVAALDATRVISLGLDVFAAHPALAIVQGTLAGGAFLGLVGFIAGLGTWKAAPQIRGMEGADRVLVVVRARAARSETVAQLLHREGAVQVETSG